MRNKAIPPGRCTGVIATLEKAPRTVIVPDMRISALAPYLIAAACVIVAAKYGVPKSLGAHPFWSVKVAWIGAPIGIVTAFLFRPASWMRRIGTFLVLLILASLAAHQGRLEFAASFAENRLAGLFWFYGWIAVAGTSTALIASLLTPGFRRS